IAHPRFGPFARALLVPRGRAHDLRRKFGRDHCLAPDRKRKIHRIESLHIILPVTTLFRSEEHTSELPSLMRISYSVFCLKKKSRRNRTYVTRNQESHYS